jgi:hypothetical protein
VTTIKKGTKRMELDKALQNINSGKSLDAKKYSGIIKLEEDPIEIQKRLRNEWE